MVCHESSCEAPQTSFEFQTQCRVKALTPVTPGLHTNRHLFENVDAGVGWERILMLILTLENAGRGTNGAEARRIEFEPPS